jgi:tight adherence protein B
MNPFIIIAIVLIIVIFVGTVAAVYISSERQKKNRTMSIIRGQANFNASGDRVSEQDKRRADLAKKLKEQSEDEKKGKKAPMSLLLKQAGMSISARQFMINSAILAVILMPIAKFVLGYSVLVTIFVGIIGFFGVPRYIIRWRTKRRQKKFLEEFADALEAMVRLLKAGMPVAEAINMAGREFTGPVGEEMSHIYDSQKIGVSLHEASLEAAQRMPLTEMQMFATGIAIQSQTGASLSEVLMNLAGVIRSRYRLKRKVAALSSEAKASAMIIGALPFVVGGGLWAINPEYMDPLFYTKVGKMLLMGCAFWMSLGIFSMKLMINFKV